VAVAIEVAQMVQAVDFAAAAVFVEIVVLDAVAVPVVAVGFCYFAAPAFRSRLWAQSVAF